MYGIGIGESDFKILRIKKDYYIDKTKYIKDIIDNRSKVLLITRPRRFGKTLNMSMLRYYFDCTKKDNKELFEGLKIMKQDEKYTSKLGYYPCIYLTLKDAGLQSYELMIMQLRTLLMDIYYENRYLLEEAEMAPGERNTFNKILLAEANEIEIINGIKMLSKIMSTYYNKPVMLFLDEYDVPLQNAYVEGYYEECIKFFKTFYGITFKDNPYLEKTILTGVSRVAKESIFSGANNFDVYTVLNDEFSDDFGITEEESIGANNSATQEKTKTTTQDKKETETTAQMKRTMSESVTYNGTSKLTWPIKGNIILPYSVNSTIYFESLDQYRINKGILIEAKEGDEVKAVRKAKVREIKKSAEYGQTVLMDLGNEYTVLYGQLKDIRVKEGTMVNAGEVIAKVAEPTSYYTLEGTNLYFQMEKDKKSVDPLKYLE